MSTILYIRHPAPPGELPQSLLPANPPASLRTEEVPLSGIVWSGAVAIASVPARDVTVAPTVIEVVASSESGTEVRKSSTTLSSVGFPVLPGPCALKVKELLSAATVVTVMTELFPIRIPAFGRNLKPAGAVTVTRSFVLGAVFPITTATVVSTGLVSATEDSRLKPDKVGALRIVGRAKRQQGGPYCHHSVDVRPRDELDGRAIRSHGETDQRAIRPEDGGGRVQLPRRWDAKRDCIAQGRGGGGKRGHGKIGSPAARRVWKRDHRNGLSQAGRSKGKSAGREAYST